MWKKPWSPKEGITIGGGLVIVGVLLQFSVGPVNWDVFAWPVNIFMMAIYVLLLALGYAVKDKVYAIRYLMSWKAAVPTLVYATVLAAIMGVTQQVSAQAAPLDPLGLSKMLSFWPFVLIFFLLTTILGLVAIKQAAHLSWARVPSLASHIGLFLVIVCGTLGSADMQRLKMFCEYGQPEWRGLDSNNQVHNLDVAIQLDKFIMEQYKEDKMPKRFASEVEIMTQDGKHIQATIDVNKPYSVNGWKIYQYGYDQAMGPMSQYSVFELVRDPWLTPVYAGFGLLCMGAIGMLVGAKSRKEAKA